MGRKTFESLPGILPNRKHLIITNNDKYTVNNENVEIITDINEVIQTYEKAQEEAFVIGGGKIYKELLPYCNKLYITEINAENNNADTYFPEFDKEKYEKKIIGQESYNDIKYEWVVYVK